MAAEVNVKLMFMETTRCRFIELVYHIGVFVNGQIIVAFYAEVFLYSNKTSASTVVM